MSNYIFTNIVILGTGLMSGSIAKDIKRRKIANYIYGYDINKKYLNYALKKKIIDRKFNFTKNFPLNNSLFIIATNIFAYRNIFHKIYRIYKNKNILITDIASIKESLDREFTSIFSKKHNFIACHPIAGSEKNTIIYAKNNLFLKKQNIITRKYCNQEVIKVKLLWQKIGAKNIFINSDMHDRIYAITSHLIQKISFDYKSNLSKDILVKYNLYRFFRLEFSNYLLWNDIFALNNKYINYYYKLLLENYNKLNLNKEFLKRMKIKISLYIENNLSSQIDNKELHNILLSRVILIYALQQINDYKLYKDLYQGKGGYDFVSLLQEI